MVCSEHEKISAAFVDIYFCIMGGSWDGYIGVCFFI